MLVPPAALRMCSWGINCYPMRLQLQRGLCVPNRPRELFYCLEGGYRAENPDPARPAKTAIYSQPTEDQQILTTSILRMGHHENKLGLEKLSILGLIYSDTPERQCSCGPGLRRIPNWALLYERAVKCMEMALTDAMT